MGVLGFCSLMTWQEVSSHVCSFIQSFSFKWSTKAWLRKYNGENVISKVNLDEEVKLLSYNFWIAFLSPFFHEQDIILT